MPSIAAQLQAEACALPGGGQCGELEAARCRLALAHAIENSWELRPLVDADVLAAAGALVTAERRQMWDPHLHSPMEPGCAVCPTFDAMGLAAPLLRGIYAYGFENPSRLQQLAIKPFAGGHDLVCLAQSGTGKTALYAVGVLQRIDLASAAVQALILVPTRELSAGIHKVIISLGEYLSPQLTCCSFYSGFGASGAQIMIGTPGRVLDWCAASKCTIKMLVLDEADEMLSRGYMDPIHGVLRLMPPKCQVGIFSATLPAELVDILAKFTWNPVQIHMKRDTKTLKGSKQFYVMVDREEWKLDTLYDLMELTSRTRCVIYVNTRRKVDWLVARMRAKDYTVSCVNGEMDQKEHNFIMDEFYNAGSSRCLITTDVLNRTETDGREQVSLVINYDLPTNYENYIHRIGRNGCFGRQHVAISFLTAADVCIMREIEQVYNTTVEELPVNVADIL